jgi:uncharacterized protein (TIGR00255 family)
MIRSMTGFGRGQAGAGQFTVKAEARSVNNRNLRMVWRLPDRLQGMETDLEQLSREYLLRGTVTVAVTLDDNSGDTGYILDAAAIQHYRESLRAAGEEVPLSVLLTLPGAIRRKSGDEVPEELAAAVRDAVRAAMVELVAARAREGQFIWNDMLARCKTIGEIIDRVEKRGPQVVEEYRKRLGERLAKLLQGSGSPLAEEDFRREVALFADRCDISEETTRLRSHLALMSKAGAVSEAYGRKLEFLMQEMFREANTMGSKSNDSGIVHEVLDVKAEVEKLREQALNVE